MTTASTPKGERRRQALVEAASQLLTERGFDAIRHRAVAERAGLPLASTTYYFDSLDELIIAAVEHHARGELARGWANLQAMTDQSIETLIEMVLDQLLGVEPGSEAVLLRYERLVATGRRPYLRPLMQAMSGEMYDLLAEMFAKSGLPVSRERLEQVVHLVDGAVLNAIIEIHSDPRETARRMLRATLD
jgi:DNA-binding transcriptional regulator YbjK